MSSFSFSPFLAGTVSLLNTMWSVFSRVMSPLSVNKQRIPVALLYQEFGSAQYRQEYGHLYKGRALLHYIDQEVKYCFGLPLPELLNDESVNKDIKKNKIILTCRTQVPQTFNIQSNYLYVKQLHAYLQTMTFSKGMVQNNPDQQTLHSVVFFLNHCFSTTCSI